MLDFGEEIVKQIRVGITVVTVLTDVMTVLTGVKMIDVEALLNH